MHALLNLQLGIYKNTIYFNITHTQFLIQVRTIYIFKLSSKVLLFYSFAVSMYA